MKKYYFLPWSLFISFAMALSAQNPRNLLIDDVTSTACSHCACMDSVLNRVVSVNHPNTIVFAMHGWSSAFYLIQFDDYMNALGLGAGTATLVNRQGTFAYVESISDTVDARYNASPQSPVKIQVMEKSFNPVTRWIGITLNLFPVFADLEGIFRINLCLTEDHLMGPQAHDPGCPGGDPYPTTTIPHYNVARQIVLGIDGETLISGVWAKDQVITKSYTFKIDSSSWVAENLKIVIYVDKKGETLGTSEIQQAILQSVTRPVGIAEIKNGEEPMLSVYPVPATGMMSVDIRVNGIGSSKLELVNGLGQRFTLMPATNLGCGTHQMKLSTGGFTPGIYTLVLTNETTVLYKKLIID